MFSRLSESRRKRMEQSPPRRGGREEPEMSSSIRRLGRSVIGGGSERYETTYDTSKSLPDVVVVIMQESSKSGDRFGIAIHDTKYPDVELGEFIDSREYTRLKTMISMHQGFDIVVQNGNEERGHTKLLGESLVAAFPDALLQSIGTRFFNATKGEKLLKSLANEEVTKVAEGILKKPLALGAFAVLLKYLQETRHIYFRKSTLRLREIVPEDTCMIDYTSWQNLEIIDPEAINKNRTNQLKEKRTLLAVLDHAITNNGARLLRSNTLQPSTNHDTIYSRMDAIEELIEGPQIRGKLRQLLARTHDLDRAMAMCIQTSASWTVRGAEVNITQIINLVQTLRVVLAIRDELADANVKSALLVGKLEYLGDARFEEILAILCSKIGDSVSEKKNSLGIRNIKCFAIKEGVSINLDVARKAYMELLARVDEISREELYSQFGDNPAVRLSYSKTRGFHYTLATKEAQTVRIPMMFSEVVRNRTTVTFSSRKMTSLNDRIEEVVAEIFLASDVVIDELIERIQPHLPAIYYAMDALSTLDFLCSLATYSNARSTVRPQFGTSFAIKNGRHPILDWADPEATISNDTCLTPDRRFGIITGPNMAGKSTYLKQVTLISIMAQTGCFVPADFASIPIYSRIFSRMGHNDDLMQNKSSFACEMTDAATILNFANRKSLVVMDELARSTSTEEGIAITYAISEAILALNCYTFLATHFLDLSILANQSTAVENYHFRPSDNPKFQHKLLHGPYRGPLYGFDIVELSPIPDEIISYAAILARQLRSQALTEKRDFVAEKRRLKVYAAHRIIDQVKAYRQKFKNNTWHEHPETYNKILAIRQNLIDDLEELEKEEHEVEDEEED